ncbi:MAG: hypothetical protein AMXMBFR36_32550 [Acidobacteriota bacterium]
MSSVRSTVLAVVGLAASAGAVPAPAPPETAPAPATAIAEGTRSPALFWNARERTAAALGRLDAGDPTGAAESLDTAWRLRPEDPLAAYNAGSGRLLAGRPDALPALEAAARALAASEGSDPRAPELAADAYYNLGNARLAGGDAGGALEAYAETLRRAPRREDAKRNLELALRALEQQQQQQQNPGSPGRDDDTQNDEAGGQDTQTGDGDGEPKPDETTSREGEDEDRTGGESREGDDSFSQPGAEKGAPNGTGDSSSPTDAPPTPPSTEGLSPSSGSSPSTEESSNSPDTPPSSQPAAPAGSRRRERLPGFVDQPELTADQAAALLDAVEDLERQQRRQRALERARRRSEVEKDW